MALGINPYEETQMLLSARAITKKMVKDKPAVAEEPQYADDGSIYRKEDLESFYSSNIGYLVASGIKAAENIFRTGALATGQFEAIEEMGSIKVNPETVHGAVRTIGDIGQTMLPFFVPGIGLTVGAATMAGVTGIESVEAGMDAGTASRRAAFAGGSAVAMAALQPLSGKALSALMEGKSLSSAIEVGKSAALNIGVGAAQRGIDYELVKAKYPEFAEKMEVLGATTVGTDIALWGLFAGLGYKGIRSEMKKAGYSLTEANRAIRAAEEAAGADTAINDAIYTRRANKSYEDDGPLLTQQEYAVKRAAIDEALTRIENADPLPEEAPESMKVGAEPVKMATDEGRLLYGENVEAPVARDEVVKFIDSFGIDKGRVTLHDGASLPDFVLRAAAREGGNAKNIEAWMGKDGNLHINLDAFDSIDRLKDVVGFHELTHAGQDAELIQKAHGALFEGKGEYTEWLRGEVSRIAKERGYDMTTKEGTDKAVKEATAEAMMDAVSRGKVADVMNESFFSTMISKVKDALRSIGVKIEYTDADAARLIGTMWARGKERMAPQQKKIDMQWQTIRDGLANETYLRKGASKGKNYTESAFQEYLKTYYPSVHAGQYDKRDVMSTLKNLASGSSRRLTDKQKEIKANFEYDLERFRSSATDDDMPFSIAHSAPYMRELDGALARRGATGEHAILDINTGGFRARQVVTKVVRKGKTIGYLERLFDTQNGMTRAKVESALPEGERMGILSEVYPVEDRFATDMGLDLSGTYISDTTKELAKKGGSLPKYGSDSILILETGTDAGNYYDVTPEDMQLMQAARDNKKVLVEYDNFIEQRTAERLARAEEAMDRDNKAAARDDARKSLDASSNESGDIVGRKALEAGVTVKVDELTIDGTIEKVDRPAKEVVQEYQDTLSKLSGLLDCLKGA